MPTTLPPIMTTTPLVDPRTGIPTRTGAAWLQASYLRQGGQEAATNTELAGGVAGNSDHISQVEDGLGTTNTSLAGLEAEVTTLQETVVEEAGKLEALTTRVTTLEARVATLETTVTDLTTRLSALEAWKTALVAALPAAVTVTALPTLGVAPATATVLRDNLTAAWEPPLEANDAGLATAINAVRTALAA